MVSMAVFSILLVLMMQFFSGAKTLWTANEKRSTVYTDASTVFDFMTDLLQSTFCSVDAAGNTVTPFLVDRAVAGNHKIYFNSNSHVNLGGGPIRYLSFQRGSNAGELLLKVFHDKDPDFSDYFWEFAVDDLTAARTGIKTKLDGSDHIKTVSRAVTELEFEPLDASGNLGASTLTPVAIRIKLSMLENETKLKEWDKLKDDEAARKKFEDQNSYTFYRTVWLGKRN